MHACKFGRVRRLPDTAKNLCPATCITAIVTRNRSLFGVLVSTSLNISGCEEAKKAGLNKTGVYHLHEATPTGKVYTEVNTTGTVNVYIIHLILIPMDLFFMDKYKITHLIL